MLGRQVFLRGGPRRIPCALDDSMNLLFFTEKNLELTSKTKLVARVQLGGGLEVPVSKEKIPPCGEDNMTMTRPTRGKGETAH